MVDFFIDNAVKNAINKIIDNKDNLKSDLLIWRQLTKCMIREFGLLLILNEIERTNEELADADWFENKYPPEIFKEKFINEKKEFRYYNTNNQIKDLIDTKLKITDVAKSYGLDTDKKGKTTCPFHKDTKPSLMLNNKKNIFHCFGCGIKGNIITFIKKMEEQKRDNGMGKLC